MVGERPAPGWCLDSRLQDSHGDGVSRGLRVASHAMRSVRRAETKHRGCKRQTRLKLKEDRMAWDGEDASGYLKKLMKSEMSRRQFLNWSAATAAIACTARSGTTASQTTAGASGATRLL